MKNDNEIPLFPVASWQIGPIPRLELITFKPNFLTHLSQRPHEANEGRHYALTPKQARLLIEELTLALDQLGMNGFQSSTDPKH